MHGHGGILLEHLKNLGLSWDLQPGRPPAVVHDDRLDDVERARLDAAPARVDRDDRRQPGLPGPVVPVAARRGDAADDARRQPRASRWPAARRGSSLGGSSTSRRIRPLGVAGSPLPARGVRVALRAARRRRASSTTAAAAPTSAPGSSRAARCCRSTRARSPAAASASTRRRSTLDGNEVVGELGELVIRQPMPSMPVGFWNDPDGSRYRAAYFDHYPGVWRHGDWIMFTERGSSRDHRPLGRDAQPRRRAARDERALLGRRGDRRGAGQPRRPPGERRDELLLFVVLRPGVELDDELRARIANALRTALSPRHAPDAIVAVPAIPRTLTGKKLELPVKRILTGTAVTDVVSRDALVDPDVDPAVRRLRTRRGARSRPPRRRARAAPCRGSCPRPSRRSSPSPHACSRA